MKISFTEVVVSVAFAALFMYVAINFFFPPG